MATRYPDSRNDQSVPDGTTFEYYVIELLTRVGLVVQRCETAEEQFMYGDARDDANVGYEIKLDRRCVDTGRLSIEIAEKTALNRPWVDSGIFSSSIATYYIQGTAEQFWVFKRTDLRQWYRIHSPRVVDDNPPTIKKFYLSTREFPSDLTPLPVTSKQNALNILRSVAGQRPRLINWDARQRRASEWIKTHKTLDGYPYQREPE